MGVPRPVRVSLPSSHLPRPCPLKSPCLWNCQVLSYPSALHTRFPWAGNATSYFFKAQPRSPSESLSNWTRQRRSRSRKALLTPASDLTWANFHPTQLP